MVDSPTLPSVLVAAETVLFLCSHNAADDFTAVMVVFDRFVNFLQRQQNILQN